MTPSFKTLARLLSTLGDNGESDVHKTFRAHGGNGQRWTRRDHQAMAVALTSFEDWAEVERPRFDRTRIREARRALELAADARADRQAA